VSQGGVSSNVSGATLSGATPSAPSTGSAQPNSTSTSPFLWAGFGLLALTAGTAVLFLATRKR
jgi:hypothetical protein